MALFAWCLQRVLAGEQAGPAAAAPPAAAAAPPPPAAAAAARPNSQQRDRERTPEHERQAAVPAAVARPDSGRPDSAPRGGRAASRPSSVEAAHRCAFALILHCMQEPATYDAIAGQLLYTLGMS